MEKSYFNFHAALEKSSASNHVVKGFVSLNNSDRSKDFISPEAFDLERFRVNPQLMYNHTFWKDASGNDHTIGNVEFVEVATVKEIKNKKNWGIFNDSGNQIDVFSKERGPDLYHGMRGLWAKARVNIDEVWEQVESGELNTFSWKGMVSFAKTLIGDVTHYITKAIDIHEASLVFVPDNFAATFEVAKGVQYGTDLVSKDSEMEDYELLHVYEMFFNSEFFASDVEVKSWLDSKRMNYTKIEKKDGGYVVNISKDVYEGEFLSLGISAGIQVKVKKAEESSIKLSELNKFFNLLNKGEYDMENKKKKTEKELEKSKEVTEKVETEKKSDEVVKDTEVVPEPVETPKTTEDIDKFEMFADSIAQKVSKTVAETLMVPFQGCIEAMTSLNKSIGDMTVEVKSMKEKQVPEKVAEKVKEDVKVEETKKESDFVDFFAGMQKKLDDLALAQDTNEKQLQTIAKSAINEPERSEGTVKKENDPNSMFGEQWPFN